MQNKHIGFVQYSADGKAVRRVRLHYALRLCKAPRLRHEYKINETYEIKIYVTFISFSYNRGCYVVIYILYIRTCILQKFNY